MHSKSEIMINDEVIKKLFGALKNLKSKEGIEFVYNYVHLLYYKCHKINPIIYMFSWSDKKEKSKKKSHQ